MLMSFSIKAECINILLTKIEPLFGCKFFGIRRPVGGKLNHPV